jgi:endonuclease-3 related protein
MDNYPDNVKSHPGLVAGTNLYRLYQTLLDSFGHQGWWPADGWFETIVGAVLAQNVSWAGAFKAVCALKHAELMTPEAILDSGAVTIATHIHSSRYYNQKAEKLLAFAEWFLRNYQGNQDLICTRQTEVLRTELLELKGFGPETVDSILLYACEKPIFVVDAYTRRIGSRFGWFTEKVSYKEMQDYFMEYLDPDVGLFQDFHAQIVRLGNQICRTTPDCENCPVRFVSEDLYCTWGLRNTDKDRNYDG